MAHLTVTSDSSDTYTKKRKREETKYQEDVSDVDLPTTPADITESHSSVLSNGANDKRRNKNTTRRAPSSELIGPDGLSGPSCGTRNRMTESSEQAGERLDKMRHAVRTLLECIGEDPDREGLLNTPSRYARALLDLTKGYESSVKRVVNSALFQEGHGGMVVVKDIEIHSLCEHHLLPFTGKMHIGYIPNDTVIGLSKLPRIAEIFSRRLQVQERLTKEIADAVMIVLSPQGVFAVMESSHLCMAMRGVEKTGTTTVTSCALGCFEEDHRLRDELLDLVGMNKV